MRICDSVGCTQFPCGDVDQQAYLVPDIELDPGSISIVMISEAAPANAGDYFYAPGEPLFLQTTLQAFHDAGVQAATLQDLLNLGVYLTTAVKCGKTGYTIQRGTVEECSRLLEKELALFPNLKVYLLMGDVAIQAVNAITRRAGEKRVIPAGATYKLRGGEYTFRGRRALPSYLQAGPSFFIEKSKRRMIAEDIALALSLVMRP
jgi:uracil-DNA glycosylase